VVILCEGLTVVRKAVRDLVRGLHVEVPVDQPRRLRTTRLLRPTPQTNSLCACLLFRVVTKTLDEGDSVHHNPFLVVFCPFSGKVQSEHRKLRL